MSENTINIYMGAEDKVNVKDATQIIKLQGLKGDPGPKGEQGDNVNLETVAKLKELLLDVNVLFHSNSLEDIMLEYFKAQIAGLNFNRDIDLQEPDIQIHDGILEIYYVTTLPFQINDGEVQFMEGQTINLPLPSTTGPITIKFYNARMKLMFTKTVEVQ